MGTPNQVIQQSLFQDRKKQKAMGPQSPQSVPQQYMQRGEIMSAGQANVPQRKLLAG